eukprot:8613635-Pyramimonas_sp.AAC.1
MLSSGGGNGDVGDDAHICIRALDAGGGADGDYDVWGADPEDGDANDGDEADCGEYGDGGGDHDYDKWEVSEAGNRLVNYQRWGRMEALRAGWCLRDLCELILMLSSMLTP